MGPVNTAGFPPEMRKPSPFLFTPAPAASDELVERLRAARDLLSAQGRRPSA